jgi:hypothetical protein
VNVTRKELRNFDREAQDLILEAQRLGLTVRLSRKNHAIIWSKNGMTTAVARRLHSAGRAAQNARIGVRKVIADHVGAR